MIVAFQQPQRRTDHFEHFLRVLRFEPADHRLLILARRRPGEIVRKPGVDLPKQVRVLRIHHVVLDQLPAHTENALGVHRVFCQLFALDTHIFEIHCKPPF